MKFKYSKILIFGLITCLLLTLWFTWSLLLHLDQPLSLAHGDAQQTSFILKHYVNIFRSGNWSGWGTLPMFYGFPNSLFFSEGFFIPGLLAIILSIFTNNIFLISNVIAILTIFISLLSAFIYFYYLFRKSFAALVAATVFVCNPYISARFPDHLLLVSLQYIPLILLSIELYILNRSHRWLWLFVIFCLLQLYGSSIYYTIYLTLLIPIYVLVRFHQIYPRRNRLQTADIKAVISSPDVSSGREISLGFLARFKIGVEMTKLRLGLNLITLSHLFSKSLLGLILILLVGALPFIYFYHGIGRELSIDRTLDQITMGYSARVSDWFFMWPGSWAYGSLKNSAAILWPHIVKLGIPSEHNLFPGLLTGIVGLLAIFIIVRRTIKCHCEPRYQRGSAIPYLGVSYFFISILILSWLLSLGPDVVLTDQLKFPGLYRIFYDVHPLAQYLRVTTRFAVLVYLGLGYLVGFVFTWLTTKKFQFYKVILTGIFISIIIEYTGKPLAFMSVDSQTRAAYSALEKNQQIKVIVDWPMNNRIPQFMPFARSQELDSHYLLYASGFHSKKLLNGYTGHLPEAYFRRTALIATQFPTPASLQLLRDWGIDALVLHADEYANSYNYSQTKRQLVDNGLPIVAESNSLTIFSLIKINPSKN